MLIILLNICCCLQSGVSPLLHKQLEELSRQKRGAKSLMSEKRQNLVVIGQDCVEPLQALLASGHEVFFPFKSLLVGVVFLTGHKNDYVFCNVPVLHFILKSVYKLFYNFFIVIIMINWCLWILQVILSTEKKTEIRNAADKWKRKRKEEKNRILLN